MDPLKAERHRRFVSGCTGGTLSELIGLLSIVCSVGFIRFRLEQLFFSTLSEMRSLLLDLLAIVVAILLPCTILSEYVLESSIIFLSTACLLHLKSPLHHSTIVVFPHNLSRLRRLLRTFVLVYTCVCIFAVDLPIFPRRFAKTESTGVSLMDTGVGLIAIVVGLSNPAFLDICRRRPLPSVPLLKIVAKAILPCLAIGIFRTVIVKMLGYPEHVAEYGVHWNFFFTLAFIRLGGFMVGYALSGLSDFDAMTAHFALSSFLACCHQWGILPWAHRYPFFHSPSSGASVTTTNSSANSESDIMAMVHANAEGLFSLPGYFSLFLFGTALALFLRVHLDFLPLQDGDKLKILCVQGKETWHGDPRKVALAMSVAGALFLAMAACNEGSVSRRLVNLPYIALQVGLSLPLIGFFTYCVFENPPTKCNKTLRKDVIPLITVITDNSMLYFLLSNLATGMLNLLFDTLEFSEFKSAWFGAVCQLLLLTVYTVACPLLLHTASTLLVSRKVARAMD